MTQGYGETANNAWYHANGISNAFHNGQDWICGSSLQTYGTELVCPFPEGATVENVIFDSPMSTKGNGVYLLSKKIDGCQFRLILWHTGEVKVKKGDGLIEGQTVCYIGNSGLCFPAPTPDAPYNGSHLHLGLYKLVNGNYVYTAPTVMGETDPLLYFDKDSWYTGEDSGPIHDIEPLKWSWSAKGITDWWLKVISAFRFWQ